MEEFYEYFYELFTWVTDSSATPSDTDIFDRLSDEGMNMYFISYARYLTSGYMASHREEFEPFLQDGRTVDEFRRQEIEPPTKECEQLQIVALTSVFGVGVKIVYLDQNQSTSNSHTGEASVEQEIRTYTFPDGVEPKVHVLYRPGHYDLLNMKD